MKQSIVTFGELMLRLSPPDHKRIVQTDSFNIQFGGAEANVSVSLSNFNEHVQYITRLPETEIGKAALSSLSKYKVDTSESIFGGNRIGIYYLEAGASERGSKVIYDRAYSAMSEIKTGMIDWDRVFSNAKWFHWSGITPAISQNAADVCKEAIEAASKHGVTISADINYRKNLWQYGKKVSDVMPELLEGCDVIIGGQGDTKNVLGIDTDDSVNILHTCKRWQLRFPKLKKIFMSQRTVVSTSHNNYTGILFDGKKIYAGADRSITHIVDRVGTGDACTAGLIYGLNHYGEDHQKTLNFALAAASLKHTIHGDFNLVSVAEVEQLMNNNVSSGITR